ncbi:hypothetical protein [Mycobacterium deserti]|uniref:Uncharacterized protein n=1 Tax=Mycobacterium deserti TaxID=2978347 RepID=A0ABT2M3P3_9MYCO|nr:hypothetical protein [Mycobacterium deserti]MCT7656873.1 hypothetical protein [Mycobacterium deserti]
MMMSKKFKLVSAGIGAGAVISMAGLGVAFSPEPAAAGAVSETPEMTLGETETSTTGQTELETTKAVPEVTAEPAPEA